MNRLQALKVYQRTNNEFVEMHGNWLDEQKEIDQYDATQKQFFANLPSEIKRDPVFFLQLFKLLKNNISKSYFEDDKDFYDMLNMSMKHALMNADVSVLYDKHLVLEALKMYSGAYKFVPEYLINTDAEVENAWNTAKADDLINDESRIIFGYAIKRIEDWDLEKIVDTEAE